MDLAAAVAGVVDLLRGAGIRATSDLRDVNPPCVYVPPPVLSWRFGKGATATWTIAATVPNSGRDAALKNLGPLIESVTLTLALDGSPVTDGRPIDLTGLDGGAPLPAYELSFTTRISAISTVGRN
jgi:hypothetical protein